MIPDAQTAAPPRDSILLHVGYNLPTAESAVADILARRQPGYVCFANVHVVMEARDHPDFAAVLASAWRVYPDSRPVTWAMRRQGHAAYQIRGPTLANDLCAEAARRGIPIGLYGGKPEVITTLSTLLPQRFPGLRIAYAWSPPFRQLTADEQAEALAAIRASGAQVLLVGLGCPKQERWMQAFAAELPLPLLGVGAWFDFASGAVREAPHFMRVSGLEWLHRLFQDPHRLWRRYAIHNPRFCWLVAVSIVRHALTGTSRTPPSCGKSSPE